MNTHRWSSARWGVLALATLTNTLVVAAPGMVMPVLFAEISADLNLNLVQLGAVWGISSLPMIVTSLAGGAVGDRFGPRRVLVAACLLAGVTGALRGLSGGFTALAVTMFLFGAVSPMITMNNLKACGMWFPREQLGLASGFLSLGMALGFLLGSLLGATVLSPWLGGWRAVLFFFGAVSLGLALPWLFIPDPQPHPDVAATPQGSFSLREGVAHVARLRPIWLFGLTIFGVSGCLQGALGYLPLYLRGQGWPPASADGALAAFHTVSMAFVLPIALGSDRLGERRWVLVGAGLMMTAGVALLSVAQGGWVWLAVCLAGIVRDGFMAVFLTSVIETRGVGLAYAGTATGMVMVFSGLGNLVAPPIGNSLAAVAPGLPFVFWAGLMALGVASLMINRPPRQTPGLRG
jgi:MFS family permease